MAEETSSSKNTGSHTSQTAIGRQTPSAVRVFLVFEVGVDPELVVLWARRVATRPESVHLHGLLPEASHLDAQHEGSLLALEQLQELVSGWCPRTTYALSAALDLVTLREAVAAERATMAVLGPLLRNSPWTRASVVLGLALDHHVAVLSVGASCEKSHGPLRRIRCERPNFASVSDFISTHGAQVVSERPELEVIAGDAMADARAWAFGLARARSLQNADIPTLVLPRSRDTMPLIESTFAMSDTLVLAGHDARVAVDRVSPFGQSTPFAGDAKLQGADVVVADGSFTFTGEPGPVVVSFDSVHTATATAYAPTRPLQLIDALKPETPVLPECEPIYVRLRDSDGLSALREKLRPGAIVIDASAWLDDGRASDVPRAVDELRLSRLQLRLANAGVRMASLSAELDALTGSALIAGQEISLELDNARARQAVIDAIDGAKHTLHWQCYMVEVDSVTAAFAAAMRAAAARGVRVRLLVDALYSRFGAIGEQNPLLTELQAVDGIEVRAISPVQGMPTLLALKRRNHRKLIIVDGAHAFVSGRNMGAPYYTGFGEVTLTRASLYRDVPWLDCGARIAGPLVSHVQRAFATEWVAAGGEPFAVAEQPGKGALAARLVLHDGLCDTRTLDAQLILIRHARERLVIVNTFPLLLELQRALIAAAKRGVRVQILFGNVRPHFGTGVPFTGGAIRQLADQLVRSRLDAVIAAGGEAYELCLPLQPNWDPALERVLPHVHAKLMLCDDRAVAVGSANLDVTAAYWESEALLIVQDRDFTRSAWAAVDGLIAQSSRIDPEDERWKAEASQRAWLSRNWPSLIS